eukprot:1608105-Pyramimonas_sp.AAC.1
MGTVAIVFPVETALKVVATIAVLLAAGFGVLCCCCRMAKKNERMPEPEVQQATVQPTPKAPKLPKQSQRAHCDAGAMGP